MRMFELLRESAHEQVVWWHDRDARPALHRRDPQHASLGPALGGLRDVVVRSEDEALRDALRLVARHDLQGRRLRSEPGWRQSRC